MSKDRDAPPATAPEDTKRTLAQGADVVRRLQERIARLEQARDAKKLYHAGLKPIGTRPNGKAWYPALHVDVGDEVVLFPETFRPSGDGDPDNSERVQGGYLRLTTEEARIAVERIQAMVILVHGTNARVYHEHLVPREALDGAQILPLARYVFWERIEDASGAFKALPSLEAQVTGGPSSAGR